MKLSVIGSSSKGNGYVIHSETEALVIEAGVSLARLMKAVSFNYKKISGCIVTHEHADHAKYADRYIKQGIPVYMSKGTNDHMKSGKTKSSKLSEYSNTNLLTPLKSTKIGRFNVLSFGVQHDAAEPLGFLINHPDIGNVLFLTDTYYTEYKFKNLNHLIVEANFCKDIITERFAKNQLHPAYYNRLEKSHMSIQTTLELLKANDLSKARNIVLIHLSDGNSDAVSFKKQVVGLTGLPTTIADVGTELELVI